MNTIQPLFFPRFFSGKSIVCFAFILVLCIVLFFQKALSFQWIAFGLVEVIGFFFFANLLTKRWGKISNVVYQKKLFWVSFGIRVMWVVFSYIYFTEMTGEPFEFDAADSKGYYGEAKWAYGLYTGGKFDQYLAYIGVNYADMGYPLYLSFLWNLFGDSIILPRIIKALLGAFTCLLMYKIGCNNFGEGVGRIAGIFGMLLPNLIYYTGLHVKETELVFLTVVFVYYADKLMKARKFRPWDIIFMCLALAAVFFFRTVLAVCLISSLALAVFTVSKRVSSRGKRLGLFFLLLIGGAFILATPMGDVIFEYVEASDRNLDSQMSNYANRAGGNKLAKYGSKSIFLPFMLMAPFPTLVDTAQYNPMMLGGAFFTRNVYAFFIFIALFALYKRQQLRNHALLLATIATYLFVLASSGFALSERFHLPIVPFLLILAAYGVTQVNVKNKKYYVPYLVIVSVLVIGWNWFKLAGRV